MGNDFRDNLMLVVYHIIKYAEDQRILSVKISIDY